MSDMWIVRQGLEAGKGAYLKLSARQAFGQTLIGGGVEVTWVQKRKGASRWWSPMQVVAAIQLYKVYGPKWRMVRVRTAPGKEQKP